MNHYDLFIPNKQECHRLYWLFNAVIFVSYM